jgi:hypothetical protein
MASIDTSVVGVLITLIVLGVLFYLGIIIAGTSSYECLFQRVPWSKSTRSREPRLSKELGLRTEAYGAESGGTRKRSGNSLIF